MNEHKSSAGKGGMGFLGVLQIVFIVLKLCKLIKWSWPVVLIPLWIEIAWIGTCPASGTYREHRKSKQKITGGRYDTETVKRPQYNRGNLRFG